MKKTVYVVSILGLCPMSLFGTNIVFGGTFFADVFSADGTQVESGASAGSETGEVNFQLGVFVADDGMGGVSEFTPSTASVGEFESRFLGLGFSDFNSGTITSDDGGSSIAANNFGSSIAFDSSSTLTGLDGMTSTISPSQIQGFQLYIFGYDSFDLQTSGSSAEFFLATGNDFVVPTFNGLGANNDNFPVVFDVNNASTAVIGRIDGSTGGGSFEVTPTLGVDDFQFATVPEPSALILLSLGALTSLRRKRVC